MSIAINIKTNPNVKMQAQMIAEQMGLSLSGVINAMLRQFVRTKSLYLSLTQEEPSLMLKETIKNVEKNYQIGKTSPTFQDAKKAIKWLQEK